jgi:hypothetical protein
MPDGYQGEGYTEIIEDVVTRTKDTTRVYVFIGENLVLLHLMNTMEKMHDKGKLDMKEYIVLAVDNSLDDDMGNVNECHRFIAPPWSNAFNRRQNQTRLNDPTGMHNLYSSVLRIVPSVKDFRVKK